MISRGIVGKRIVKIHQARYETRPDTAHPHPVINVTALELEDGTLLKPMTIETETGEYAHDFVVVKPGAKS